MPSSRPQMMILLDDELLEAIESQAKDAELSPSGYTSWIVARAVLPDRENPKPKAGRPRKSAQ